MDKNVPNIEITEVGRVREVKQGIVRIEGLPSCVYGQLLRFSGQMKGMVIGFTPKEALAVVMGNSQSVSVGDTASSQDLILTIPCGGDFLGRVVNSLAEPCDGRGEIPFEKKFPVFKEAPGILDRLPLDEPLSTGIKIIDMLVPIGKGQRELVIGDRQTGKTAICLDTIINQKDKNVVCVYCWIGGPQSGLKKNLFALQEAGALPYTVVVSAAANSSAAEQYLAPYSAAAIGEYFMSKGRDVLVIFDDLTKHAWVYRQMSLLLERSPGREAYPGDIFYLHSQLLERAGKMSIEAGGGSMTFLPIAETLQGDITGYIQTNLISITDGQIYFSSNLFREGFRPAIDLGLSVSRVGSKVQHKVLRALSQGIRLEYAQYRDLLRLTKMRTRLMAEALERMRRGEVLAQIFNQANNQPVSLAEQAAIFYAFQRRILEAVDSEDRRLFIEGFVGYARSLAPDFINDLGKEGELSESSKKQLDGLIGTFFRKIKEDQR